MNSDGLPLPPMPTTSPSAPWLLLQLTDGSFPSGGFAHSAGLEAAVRLGGLQAVEPFLDQLLVQTAYSALPFVRAACHGTESLADLDEAYDATIANHVANRASRAQGRAFVSAASRIFEEPPRAQLVGAVAEHAERGPAHYAPMLGAICNALGVQARDAQIVFLHGTARTVLSAAVRLSLIGPLEAQRIQAGRSALLDHLLAQCTHRTVDDAAQTAPLVEIYGALHDELDARLFQS